MLSNAIARACPRPPARALLLLLACLQLLATALVAAPPQPWPAAPRPVGTPRPPAAALPALALWPELGARLGGDGRDEIADVALDAAGNLYVAGLTTSSNFPGAAGAPRRASAAFVARLAPDGGVAAARVLDGDAGDEIRAIAFGPDGDLYLAGVTSSADLLPPAGFQPARAGISDGFLVRLSPDLATLRSSTYLGGSAQDNPSGLAVGADGAIFVTGITTSPDFPTLRHLPPPTNGATCYGGVVGCTDIFVTKLSPDGASLIYSTYHGGSDWDAASSIAVDSQGRAYVYGSTSSPDLPVRNAIQPEYRDGGGCRAGAPVPCLDLFLTRFTAEGAIDYSTYLGGLSADHDDGSGLAVDGDGRAYLTGRTYSTDFPTARATQPTHGSTPNHGNNSDSFVTVVSPDGRQLEFSSFLGGDGAEVSAAITTGPGGRIYLTGYTNAGNFPTVSPLQATSRNQCERFSYPPFPSQCFDGFLAVIALGGAEPRVELSTLLSGSRNEFPRALAVAPGGEVLIAGVTDSPDLPIGGSLSGAGDGFIFRLSDEPTAGSFYVAPDGNNLGDCRAPERPCATIGAAVDRAAAGSTVNVAAGTYREAFDLQRDVGIAGAGLDATVIDGAGRNRPVIGVGSGTSVTLTDLRITGGDVQVPNSNGGGGISNLGTLSLERVAVRGNRHSGGGGGIGNDGTLTLRDSVLRDNVGNSGGGIFNNASLTVVASTIADNQAQSGGGIANSAAGVLRVEGGSLIRGNRAANGGGGIVTSGVTLLDASTVSENTTDANSGGGVLSFGRVELIGATLSANSAPGGGGGGLSLRGTALVSDSVVGDNQAQSGGGIASRGSLTLTGTTVAGNSATIGGGGLMLMEAGTTTITGSTVSDNRSAGDGAGIYVNNPQTRVELRDTTLSGNVGGGLGGALFNNGQATVGAGSRLEGNGAARGGAIASKGALTVTGALLLDNRAEQNGGAVHLYGDSAATLRDSTVRGNRSAGDGGGITLVNPVTRLELTASTVSGNEAAEAGGGINNGGQLTMLNSTVSGNRARTFGGVINFSVAALRFSTITANAASERIGGVNNAPSGTLTLHGAIVAGNAAPVSPDCHGTLASDGGNLIGDASGCMLTIRAGSQLGTAEAPLNPMLGPLALNGGATATHALYPGSPARDTAPPRCPPTDQRGVARPQLGGCDSGALEMSDTPGLIAELFVAPAGSDANDCGSPDTACRTLRGALARAAVGATINVAAGTYNEFIVIGRDVRIVGADATTTVVRSPRPDGQTEVARVAAGVTASLASLTLTGGFGTDSGGLYNAGATTLTNVIVRANRGGANGQGGGGIHNAGGGTLTLRGVLITENQTDLYWGGGLSNERGGTVTIEASTISGNRAPLAGGGVYNQGAMTIRDSTVSGNTGWRGAGINSSGVLTITGSTISENSHVGTGGGGGIYSSGRLELSLSRVSGNVTGGNGGGLLSEGATTIIGSTFADNRAPENTGGGLHLTGAATASVIDSTFSGNSAVVGGAIVARAGTTLEVRTSILEGNSAYENGALSSSGTTTIVDSLVRGNRSLRDPQPRYGGSGAAIGSDSALTVTGSILTDNVADNAGGVFYQSGGTLTITRSTLDGNRGHVGGAIYATPSARVVVEASTLSNNVANYAGGAITSNGRLTVVSSTFSGNRAGPEQPDGSGLVRNGGAIYADGPTAIRASTFVGNGATQATGAIVNGAQPGATSFTIAGSIVAGNRSPDYPDVCGAITSLGGNLFGAGDTCGFRPAAGDRAGTRAAPLDPLLGPLADNGGPTLTHLPQAGSPALEAGGQGCAGTADQRGLPRPLGRCDSGAVELGAIAPAGFERARDTFSFVNASGTFEERRAAFFADFGLDATTHRIVNEGTLESISGRDELGLPISFAAAEISAVLPISLTAGINTPDGRGRYIPNPVAYLYEEIIVQQVYDSPLLEDLPGTVLGGLCAGMAASAGGFLAGPGADTAFDLSRYNVAAVRDLAASGAALDLIHRYQGRQLGLQVLSHLADEGAHTPRTLLDQLAMAMARPDYWRDPLILGIFGGSGCDDFEVGHALLPYRVEAAPDGDVRVFVYDPNYPPVSGAAERFITLDLERDRWSYPISDTKVWSGAAIYSTPLQLFAESPLLPYTRLEDGAVVMVSGGKRGAWGGKRGAWGGKRGAWGQFDNVWVTAPDGTQTGCIASPDGTRYVQEISRSMRLRAMAGALPQALFLPADQPLTFHGAGGPAGETGNMMIFGPGGVMGVIMPTGPGLGYQAGITPEFRTLDLRTSGASIPVSAFQMHETADGKTTRVFAVSNMVIGSGGGTTMEVERNLGSLTVTNPGDRPRQVVIGLGAFGAEVVSTTTYTDTIGPNEVREYTPPRWDDLGGQPPRVEVHPLDERLEALYTFTEGAGTMVENRSPRGDALDLTIADPDAVRWEADGLLIASPTILTTAVPAAELTRALQASGELTVEAWLRPAAAGEVGFARIVTLSSGLGRRNLTLGHDRTDEPAGERFIGRVRTQATGLNARSPDVKSRPLAPGDGLVHVVLTRNARGEARLYVNGRLSSRRMLRGDLSSWDSGFRLALANELGGGRPWLGTLREVAIYSRAISAGEVRRRAEAGPR